MAQAQGDFDRRLASSNGSKLAIAAFIIHYLGWQPWLPAWTFSERSSIPKG